MVSYSIAWYFMALIHSVLILIVVDKGLVLIVDTEKEAFEIVLILVVMEDGLVHVNALTKKVVKDLVLILVVMEDGLIHDKKIEDAKEEIVLILVVMEDGLIPKRVL